jgi:hypothetical protein
MIELRKSKRLGKKSKASIIVIALAGIGRANGTWWWPHRTDDAIFSPLQRGATQSSLCRPNGRSQFQSLPE